ncbi:UDP-N-acetylmuramate dehydrogenase [Granulicella arctica]|uniref:UDP-N-acetylenolpyruvoylglucosamine reductase n=1 Tax=Granulicella arctica TaxID=940613 RepID=A0A7Y9TGJ5_9BACT|nr:UDP-N-acetylmuramate dehydrogenase [Granulicella arctica]NYF79961.1 UDP-N-acetylmuramate dehydrogenase [Granulicella arctica]
MIEIQEQVLLGPYTTFGIGGPARYFVTVTTPEELVQAVEFARARGMAMFVLGGGSNLLVGDAGFDGLVIRMALRAATVRVGEEYEVAAGTEWDGFVRAVCEEGISGVECLAGIPGLVGGSPIQNIGAYGQEVAETIVSVTALEAVTLRFVALERGACGFGYRRSIFNSTERGRYIVTGVRFRFSREGRVKLAYADLQRHFAGHAEPSPIEVYHAVRGIRQGKGMLLVEGDADSRSAGSFFKNPVVPEAVVGRIAGELGLDVGAVPRWAAGDGMVKLPAAWLLERAGFAKGFAMGRAGISSRHTLALINRGGASFAEMTALRDRIVGVVEERFGVRLEQEPVLVN